METLAGASGWYESARTDQSSILMSKLFLPGMMLTFSGVVSLLVYLAGSDTWLAFFFAA